MLFYVNKLNFHQKSKQGRTFRFSIGLVSLETKLYNSDRGVIVGQEFRRVLAVVKNNRDFHVVAFFISSKLGLLPPTSVTERQYTERIEFASR